MVDKTREVLKSKFEELIKEKSELIEKVNSIVMQYNEMIPHVNRAKQMILHYKSANDPGAWNTMESLAKNFAEKPDFTMEKYEEWQNEISTIKIRVNTIKEILATLKEIFNESNPKTSRKS